MRRGGSAAIAGLALLLAAGPALTQGQSAAAAAPGPCFPAPPAAARLVYVRSIDGNADFRGGRSLLARIGDVLAGGPPAAALARPHGVSAGRGVLLVADAEAGLVHAFDLQASRWRRLPKEGRLAAPADAVVGDDGTILVTDPGAAAVLGFGADGSPRFAVEGPFVRPAGAAFDPARGRYLVADPGAHVVAAVGRDGAWLGALGGRGEAPGSFNFPVDVCVLADGTLCVLDAMNHRVQRLDADGAPLAGFGTAGDRPGYLARPRGIACDAAGRCYVTDALQDNFQIYDAAGALLLAVGVTGRGPGEFWMPAGIAVDEQGRIYVADAYNRRVQVFAPAAAPGGS